MASIEERSDNYRVRWRKGGRGGSNQSCTFYNLPLALRAKQLAEAHRHDITDVEVERIIKGDEYQPLPAKASDKPLVNDWATVWLASRTRIGPDQRRRIRSQLDRVILPAIGRQHIDHITGGDITGVLAQLRDEGLTPATRTRYFATMSSLFAYAVKEKVIPDNPTARTDFVRDLIEHDDVGDEDDGHVYLSRHEYDLIWRNMHPFGRPVIDLLVDTGTRWSEATAIEVRSAVLRPPHGRPSIRIRQAWKRDEVGGWYIGATKGRNTRSVTVGRHTVEAVESLLRTSGGGPRPDDAFLVTATRGGRMMHSNFSNRYWAPAVGAAMRCPEHPPALPEKRNFGPRRQWRPWEVSTCDCKTRLHRRPTIHDLRHTHVAWMIAEGQPIAAISRRIGHKMTSTTELIYAGILAEVQEAMADSIDRIHGRR